MTDQPSKVVPVEVIARLLTIAREADRPNEAEMLEQRIEEAQTAAPQGGGEADIERLCAAMLDGVGCTPWDHESWDRDGTDGASREGVRASVRRILAALKPQTPDVLGEVVGPDSFSATGKFFVALDHLTRMTWRWGESCGIDDVSWDATGDSYNEKCRADHQKAKRALIEAFHAAVEGKTATPPGDVLGGEGEDRAKCINCQDGGRDVDGAVCEVCWPCPHGLHSRASCSTCQEVV